MGVLLAEIGIPLTVVTLVLYATVRIAVDQFLRPFDMSAETIGLGYEEILAPVASVVSLVLVAGGLALVPLRLVIGKYGNRWPSAEQAWDFAVWVAVLPNVVIMGDALVAAAGGILHLLAVLTGGRVDTRPSVNFYLGTAVVAIVAFAFGMATAMVAAAVAGIANLSDPFPTWFGAARAHVRPLTMALAAVSLSALAVGAGAAGRYEAHQATSGSRVRPTILGVAFPGIEASPVIVTATADSSARNLNDRCLMYLAQSDGLIFLYDPKDHRLVRASAMNVVLTEAEGSCPSR